MLATKLTCLPLLLVPILVYWRDKRDLFVFLSVMILVFMAFVLLIMRGETVAFLKYLLGFWWRALTHMGKYGDGKI